MGLNGAMQNVWKLLLMLVFTAAFIFQACKKGYDVPPDNSGYDPDLTVTHTISQVQDFISGSLIREEVVISGIVNIDDREGNYYKKITIQDETGGIEILLDQNNLYSDYPVGRKIYVRLKGLYKGDNTGTPQVGYIPDGTGSLSNIPYTLIDRYVIKANYPHDIPPVEVTLAGLASLSSSQHLINRLVIIRDAEFSSELIGQSYADPASIRSATNRDIQQCGSPVKIALRTSGYARFQSEPIPGGRGTIRAIYTRYGSTPQLYIRSTDDIDFLEERCEEPLPSDPEVISIADLKEMYSGTSLTLPALKIAGVVISDRTGGNIAGQNMIIQQGNRGIAVRLSSIHTFDLGDSVEVIVTGVLLEEFNNLLQLNGVPNAGVAKVGTAMITPKTMTLAELNMDFEDHESTLVHVNGVTISGGGTFSGSRTLSDGTGTITLYTRTDAVFASSPVPASSFSITAIAGQFGSMKQLQLRNISDIE